MLVRRMNTNHQRIYFSINRKPTWALPSRLFSSSASTVSPQSYGNISILGGITAELDRIAPRIDIRADQVKVLEGPEEFYETLKQKIRQAKRRIYLSTLYIGKSEYELISTIRDALLHNGSDLKVSVLTDALRGTRESPDASCASLLATLVAEFPDQVEIRMYHTPNLTGLRKRFIPKRINEGWGLQHIKLYGADDEIILSGANLSNDYFTNRQDRYHVFSSKRVTDYFAKIHSAVCSVSFLLLPETNQSSYALTWPSSNPAPSPLINPRAYISAITSLLRPLISPSQTPSSLPRAPLTTSIYPLVSHPPTLNTELPALQKLLSSPDIASYTFTAGYFNPHPIIISSLLACSSQPKFTPAKILTASPLANGFYNSPGISGLLPPAYSHLSLVFIRAARKANIQLREWQRGAVGQPDGWTYHAKGLWLTLTHPQSLSQSSSSPATEPPPPKAQPDDPSITVIGSSNYTTRSYTLDLEVSALIITQDERLKQQWKREEEALLARSTEVREEDLVKKERRAGWRVRLAMWIVSAVGGAL